VLRNKPDLRQWLKKLGAFFSRNWQWKLISLLLAISLWSVLISQDETLTREKVFNDVTISVMNSDTLQRNGFVIVGGLDAIPAARIRVAVPQKAYNTVTANNYNLRVDLSRIREAGEQTLPVLASNSASYGTVTDISVSFVTLQVEEYVTRNRIPVRLNVSGASPDGFYAGDASVEPVFVTVSGPLSHVENVVRCIADYSMDALSPQSGTERTAVPFRLVDGDGNAIDSALIDVTTEDGLAIDSMVVEQTLYAAKSLVINTAGLVLGAPAEGYVIKRISAEPASLTVAGQDSLIGSLTELRLAEYTEQSIDVNGLSNSVTRGVSLIRSGDIAHFSSDTVMITVEIAPQ